MAGMAGMAGLEELKELEKMMTEVRRKAIDAKDDAELAMLHTEMARIRALIEANPLERARRDRINLIEMNRFMNMWE